MARFKENIIGVGYLVKSKFIQLSKLGKAGVIVTTSGSMITPVFLLGKKNRKKISFEKKGNIKFGNVTAKENINGPMEPSSLTDNKKTDDTKKRNPEDQELQLSNSILSQMNIVQEEVFTTDDTKKGNSESQELQLSNSILSQMNIVQEEVFTAMVPEAKESYVSQNLESNRNYQGNLKDTFNINDTVNKKANEVNVKSLAFEKLKYDSGQDNCTNKSLIIVPVVKIEDKSSLLPVINSEKYTSPLALLKEKKLQSNNIKSKENANVTILNNKNIGILPTNESNFEIENQHKSHLKSNILSNIIDKENIKQGTNLIDENFLILQGSLLAKGGDNIGEKVNFCEDSRISMCSRKSPIKFSKNNEKKFLSNNRYLSRENSDQENFQQIDVLDEGKIHNSNEEVQKKISNKMSIDLSDIQNTESIIYDQLYTKSNNHNSGFPGLGQEECMCEIIMESEQSEAISSSGKDEVFKLDKISIESEQIDDILSQEPGAVIKLREINITSEKPEAILSSAKEKVLKLSEISIESEQLDAISGSGKEEDVNLCEISIVSEQPNVISGLGEKNILDKVFNDKNKEEDSQENLSINNDSSEVIDLSSDKLPKEEIENIAKDKTTLNKKKVNFLKEILNKFKKNKADKTIIDDNKKNISPIDELLKSCVKLESSNEHELELEKENYLIKNDQEKIEAIENSLKKIQEKNVPNINQINSSQVDNQLLAIINEIRLEVNMIKANLNLKKEEQKRNSAELLELNQNDNEKLMQYTNQLILQHENNKNAPNSTPMANKIINDSVQSVNVLRPDKKDNQFILQHENNKNASNFTSMANKIINDSVQNIHVFSPDNISNSSNVPVGEPVDLSQKQAYFYKVFNEQAIILNQQNDKQLNVDETNVNKQCYPPLEAQGTQFNESYVPDTRDLQSSPFEKVGSSDDLKFSDIQRSKEQNTWQVSSFETSKELTKSHHLVSVKTMHNNSNPYDARNSGEFSIRKSKFLGKKVMSGSNSKNSSLQFSQKTSPNISNKNSPRQPNINNLNDQKRLEPEKVAKELEIIAQKQERFMGNTNAKNFQEVEFKNIVEHQKMIKKERRDSLSQNVKKFFKIVKTENNVLKKSDEFPNGVQGVFNIATDYLRENNQNDSNVQFRASDLSETNARPSIECNRTLNMRTDFVKLNSETHARKDKIFDNEAITARKKMATLIEENENN